MLTRRTFLERIAAAGGASAAYRAMTGLGLMGEVRQAPFDLQGRADGVRVVVLGAGLAGLAAAYELGKRGYVVRVLEARLRPGGRVLTVRRGTVSEEEGSRQICAFDEGLYFNSGPMRIPHHHATTLHYCRELQVPLEVFAVNCDSTYLYQQKAATLNGRRVRVREARADLDGYIAELLSKAVSDDALDAVLTSEDRDRLLDYLQSSGGLDKERRYHGSSRRGPDDPRAAAADARYTPLGVGELLGSGMGAYLDADFPYQPTMLQPVGGMDRVPVAFAARLREKITYGAAVRQLRQNAGGVTVGYRERGGGLRTIEADYCVCTLPLPVLAEIDTDFADELKNAIASIPYAAAGKIGLQFKRRFWEEDDQIYGGATRSDQDIQQIVYPSHGFHQRKGVLIGYYVQGQAAKPMGDRPPSEREAIALEQGAKVHPQYRAEFETGFSVAWHRVPWQKGSWAGGSADARRALHVAAGRVYLAGDHMNLNAWMQGAFESARDVVSRIHARAVTETGTGVVRRPA